MIRSVERLRAAFGHSPVRPDEWHDFFVMVGGGAAVLLGLAFVALSLNVSVITQDATHRYRAKDTLSGMAGDFVICALVLIGRPGPCRCGHRTVRGGSHLGRRLCTRVRPGRPSRWKRGLAPRTSSGRSRCALRGPTCRRRVARRRPCRRVVCRRGRDGRFVGVHDLRRMALGRRCHEREANALDRSPSLAIGAADVRNREFVGTTHPDPIAVKEPRTLPSASSLFRVEDGPPTGPVRSCQRGLRCIGHIGGELPAWMTPSSSKP